MGILCDPKAGLEDLSQALDQDMSGQAKEAAATRAATLAEERNLKEHWDRRPMAVERMMHELGQALPSNAIIADEAVTSRPALMRAMSFDEPGLFTVSRAEPWAGPCPVLWGCSSPTRTGRWWRW